MKNSQIYMRANEVAEELGISVGHAYKIIQTLNEELEKRGYIVLRGRIDRKFFHAKLYTTRSETGGEKDGSI